MSDHATSHEHHAAAHHEPPQTSPFNERQLRQFDSDDRDAGHAIGKMLAAFFLYTVIVMSGVAYWTWGRDQTVRSHSTAPPTETIIPGEMDESAAKPKH